MVLIMKFAGTSYEIRRGRVGDAVKPAVARPPMRLIRGRAGCAGADGATAAGAGAPCCPSISTGPASDDDRRRAVLRPAAPCQGKPFPVARLSRGAPVQGKLWG
jgi:hypothetical protein